MLKISRRAIFWFIFLVLLLAAFITLIWPGEKIEQLPTSELIGDLRQGRSPLGGKFIEADLTIEGTSLTAVIDGKKFQTIIPSNFDVSQVITGPLEQGKVTVFFKEPSWSWLRGWGGIIITVILSLLVGAFMGYFWGKRKPAT